MYSSPEIEIVEDWVTIWWDMLREQEYTPAYTGTNGVYPPGLVQRRVRRAYGKPVHKNCGGDLALTPTDCGEFKVELACVKCGEAFIAEF